MARLASNFAKQVLFPPLGLAHDTVEIDGAGPVSAGGAAVNRRKYISTGQRMPR